MEHDWGSLMQPSEIRPSHDSPPVIPVIRDTTVKRDPAKNSLFCSLASKKNHRPETKR